MNKFLNGLAALALIGGHSATAQKARPVRGLGEIFDIDDGSYFIVGDDGSAVLYDAGGDQVDAVYSPTGADPVTNRSGNIISNQDGSYFIVEPSSNDAAYYDANGNFVAYYPTGPSTIDPSALPSGTVKNSDGSYKLPFGISKEQVDALIKKGADAGARWLAKEVGGSTLLVPQQKGIGTFDLKKAMPFLAIGAVILLAKK